MFVLLVLPSERIIHNPNSVPTLTCSPLSKKSPTSPQHLVNESITYRKNNAYLITPKLISKLSKPRHLTLHDPQGKLPERLLPTHAHTQPPHFGSPRHRGILLYIMERPARHGTTGMALHHPCACHAFSSFGLGEKKHS
jgi:hypothetical protein